MASVFPGNDLCLVYGVCKDNVFLLREIRASLSKVLGCPVRIDFAWEQLLAALSNVYENATALACDVLESSDLWCEALKGSCATTTALSTESAGVADAAQQQWTKPLADKIKLHGELRLLVTVVSKEEKDSLQQSELTTSWSETLAALVLFLPRDRPLRLLEDFGAEFQSRMLKSLQKNPAPLELQSLPDFDALPPPDELFRRPPYHLIITDYGHSKIVVQGSHSPSLRLLGDYMARWCLINHQDSRHPPAVAVVYNRSCWDTSSMVDMITLTSEANNIFKFSPALVLAFVEGVLGYEKVSTEQGMWTYRRLMPLKD
ncbi:hypothetical protein SEPCBS57363_002252 [Sporothrix epigloea]|uniref:Uncharacterized protein n=1 Tax=Sporothrix epigloea TaxID=1892477 RepID=A0ABP0DGH0_9PEZI